MDSLSLMLKKGDLAVNLLAEGGSEAGERRRRNFQVRTRRQKKFNIAGMLRVVPTGTERARAEVGEVRMTRPEAGVGEGARSQEALKTQ